MSEIMKWRDWNVMEVLGRGSYGTVYRIERNAAFGHTEQAALKVIRVPSEPDAYQSVRNEGMSHAEASEYFREIAEKISQEFTFMADLKGSSYIVSYADQEIRRMPDGYSWEIYIRMELLTPLIEWLQRGTVSVADIIQLGTDLCSAIELCEKKRIIHRDIKPGNIFHSDQGTFKLGDFGIARQFERTTTATAKSGTIAYMAPEVYKGQRYGMNVDLYSLGIVLYQLLNNNRTPFLPPYPQKISYTDREQANLKRMGGEALPLPCNARNVLGQVILKACAYKPADRFQNAAAFRGALLTARKALADPSSDAAQTLASNVLDSSKTLTLPPETDDRKKNAGKKPDGKAGRSGSKPVQTGKPKGPEPPRKSRKGLIAILICLAVIGGSLIHSNSAKKPEPVEPADDTSQVEEQVPDTATTTSDSGQEESTEEIIEEPVMSAEGQNAENFLNAFRSGDYDGAASWGAMNPEYANEGCVLNMPSTMYDAYVAVAKQYEEADGFTGECGFTDVDNDGVAEMLIFTPAPEATMELIIYGYRSGSVVELGTSGIGHSGVYAYPDHDGIIIGWGHMGSQAYSVLHLDGSQVVLDSYGSMEMPEGQEYLYPGNYVRMNPIDIL
ncbi:MAG: serine/threonine protein kinase [Mogibacterium sp.]|nr:serine/threonine protein kinase [Mogibacterium sp.]